ncbi:putative protein phosphatase 2C 27-like, partial [Trifolium medium]|nr:putative protein phosphatase 2C 27-like [Trifolium medium]
VSLFFKSVDAEVTGSKSSSEDKTEFLPIFRSGNCAEKGPKQYMEDEHIRIDDLIQHIGSASNIPFPGAFYGDSQIPACVGKAITSAFTKADCAFQDSSSLDISSGTTALTALVYVSTAANLLDSSL